MVIFHSYVKLPEGKAREDWDNSVDLPSSSAGSIEMPPTQSERGFCTYKYKCFQNGFVDAKRKKTHVCISPMVLWWIMTFLCLSK